MSTKSKLVPSKNETPPKTVKEVDGLAKAVESVADELRPLYHLEPVADHIGSLASALNTLANATAMSVIAKNGTEEDRAVVVAYLKNWFEEFRG